MTKLLSAVVFSLFYSVMSFSQQLPQYDINVTLNDRSRTLDGFLKVKYTNNTNDSVPSLWFNVYPNAFKSDRTAFSEYLLDKGRTDFYFSDQSKRGYINRLDFRAGDEILRVEDHPLYIDVVKVWLPSPLAPGKSVMISTPFHVKVPYNFDGIGYSKGQFQLRYWYPAIADSVKPLTNANFSSNAIGDYNVALRLPTRLTKHLSPDSEKKINDSTSILEYSAKAIQDFYIGINLKELTNERNKPDLSNNIAGTFKNLLSKPLLPAIGYNNYDGFQLGIVAQNFKTKKNYQFYIAPVYTFKSKSISGIAGVDYKIKPSKHVDAIYLGIDGSTFSYDDGVDSTGNKVFSKMFKLVPHIKAILPSKSTHIQKSLSFKTFIISERDLDFVRYSIDSFYYPAKGEYATRFLNELSFDYSSNRVLYPYRAQLQVQQALFFYRVNATGEYFFNYPKGGGMNVRLFAAKFGYIGHVNATEKFQASRFQPKLTAVRGDEDYTYSNYFVGRSETDGFGGRQIMMRDGGLKIRTDLFSGLQGRSDNWIAAINLNTSIPKIFPVNVPLKLFFDAGTYAEAWDEDNNNPRFLYVAGLQLSLFKNVINIYAPVFYSKQIRDQLKSVNDESKFSRTISFSIDFSQLRERLSERAQ